MKSKKKAPFFDSLNCAVEGLIYVIKTQRNMRLHLILGILVMIFGLVLRLDGIDFILVCLAILLVLFSEVMNTAIELQIDLISESYHPLAKIVKDICAGAVLLTSVFALLVAYLVVAKKLNDPIELSIVRLQASAWHISFICLLVVVVASILLKIFLHRGTPFHGGMPSAHAGVAFGIWVLISLLSTSTIVAFLSLVGALMVAQSRVALKAHTIWEVLVGALLGSLITLTMFQVIMQL